MLVIVKRAICRLNTKQSVRAEWEEMYAGSARVYACVLKSQPSHEKLLEHVALTML